jgi:serine/threonine protein kinase
MRNTFLFHIAKKVYLNLTNLKSHIINGIYLILIYPFLRLKHLKFLKPFSFISWHHNTLYFSGRYDRIKVFIKCEIGTGKYLKNEIHLLDIIQSHSKEKILLPRIIDSFQIPIGFIIIYEYIESPNLEKYIQEISHSDDQELTSDQIIVQLIEILDVLYDSKVVHRDFRPSNFFVKNNRLMLFDFAFSVCISDEDTIEFNPKIEKALGEQYKPEQFIWDDVFSILVFINEQHIDVSESILADLNSRKERLSYRKSLTSSQNEGISQLEYPQ